MTIKEEDFLQNKTSDKQLCQVSWFSSEKRTFGNMDKPRQCGCKGRRTCLICEEELGLHREDTLAKNNSSYVYCPSCNRAYPGWNLESYKSHPAHHGEGIEYPGIFIQLDFISSAEEASLLNGIDEMPWEPSQSGRRKQNFGPKCNFKKQKLKPGTFNGFPAFSKFVQEKFKDYSILKGFQTVEQCSLEYDPIRGASIDPHIDDCWVWGERIITVNLLADSVLTMTPFTGEMTRYNLPSVATYPRILDDNGAVITEKCSEPCYNYLERCSSKAEVVVRIPMPKRSLLVIYGPARYQWEHCIVREDITTRRVCLAYREFTPPYLTGGVHSNIGKEILEKAIRFWDHVECETVM